MPSLAMEPGCGTDAGPPRLIAGVRQRKLMSMSEPQITFEECARRILERQLRRPVVLNDDGRKPGMYDLRVGNADTPDIAIECVGAVDHVRTETWNIGPAKGPISLNLAGDWHVVLKPHARVKEIRRRLEVVLRNCEAAAINSFTPVNWSLKHHHPDIFGALAALHIESIACFREGNGTGKAYLCITGVGGAVDTRGLAIPGWIAEFLRAARQKDVISKLARSGAVQRHVCVGVSFAGVPWPVESYLGTRADHLPETSPSLPPPLSAVWIMYGRRGLRWDGFEWSFFDAIVPAA